MVLEEEKALKFGEDEEKTINAGECYFECVGSVSMNSVPAFVEKDASGYVTGYAAFSDLISYLPEVIFTGAPPITIFGTGGDMNGGTKIKLPELPNDGLGDDEKGPKIETVSLTGDDKRQTQSKTDNETVSQGASAGCGQMSIVDANSSSNMLQLLMSLLPLAGAPAIMIRRFKKKII